MQADQIRRKITNPKQPRSTEKGLLHGWTVPNPHNLPTSAVIFKGTEPRDGWKVCGGNCAECACRGCGCWELKKGETIAFYQH